VQNKVHQGGKGLSADEVAADVLKLITDMGSTERQQPIRREAAVKKWNAPPQGQLKINTDGSISETLQGSWGFFHYARFAHHCCHHHCRIYENRQ